MNNRQLQLCQKMHELDLSAINTNLLFLFNLDIHQCHGKLIQNFYIHLLFWRNYLMLQVCLEQYKIKDSAIIRIQKSEKKLCLCPLCQSNSWNVHMYKSTNVNLSQFNFIKISKIKFWGKSLQLDSDRYILPERGSCKHAAVSSHHLTKMCSYVPHILLLAVTTKQKPIPPVGWVRGGCKRN